MGEKLSSRQFGVLYNATLDDSAKLKFVKDKEREQFMTSRDIIRLMEE
jgi:hypothetical protein